MAAYAQPLRWWNAAQTEALAVAVGTECESWRDGWKVATPAEVRCGVASEAKVGGQDWRCLGARGAALAWYRGASSQAISAAMFGTPGAQDGQAPGQIAADLAAEFVQQGKQRIAAVLDLHLESSGVDLSPSEATRAWSGGVHVAIALPAGELELLANGDCVERWLENRGLLRTTCPPAVRPPLCGVAEALAHRGISLRASLAPCQVDVAQLRDLRPGDVLCLSHAIDAPLSISDARGTFIWPAYLGSAGPFKAVELGARA